MRDVGDLRDVENLQARIADGLGDHKARAFADRRAQAGVIARLDERGADAEARQRMRQQIDRTAIERSGRHDMIAGIQQGGDGKMHRRHAACGADRADAVFQRRQPLFQHRRRRIGDARVNVTRAFQVEQAGGVIRIVEHVRGGLINWHRARAGDRIGMLARMQAQRLEGRRFRSGHTSSRRDIVKPDMSHLNCPLPMQLAANGAGGTPRGQACAISVEMCDFRARR